MALFARLILALVIATICHAQEERKPIQNPAPAYPTFARRISLTGTVKVKAIVGADGQVKQVEVVGGHPLFVDAAVDAVKKWRYTPAKTETSVELEFHFRP
jgi:TonB family protein